MHMYALTTNEYAEEMRIWHALFYVCQILSVLFQNKLQKQEIK